jgi:hypothetical protein
MEETSMADDKSKTGKRDRARVAADQDYEVHHLAREAGITTEQAQQLIKAYGNDRDKLMQAARGLAKPNIRSSRI